jgi:hypothetical protein
MTPALGQGTASEARAGFGQSLSESVTTLN